MAAPRIIDYGRIEPGWREGIKSVRMLCDDYEADTGRAISGAAVEKHFKALGIPRDLSAKIHAKAAAIVGASIVGDKVGNATSPTESAIINAGAESVAKADLSHRADVRSLISRLHKLQDEFDTCEDDLGRRVGIFKSMTETHIKLIEVERRLLGMDKSSDGGIADAIRKALAE